MEAQLIAVGADRVSPEWHCLIGNGPKGYNCIPLGFGPSS